MPKSAVYNKFEQEQEEGFFWRVEAGFKLGKGNAIDSVVFFVKGETQQEAWEVAKDLTLHYYEECHLIIQRVDDGAEEIIGFEFIFYAQTARHGEVYCMALVPQDRLLEAVCGFMSSCHLDMTKALYVKAEE